MSTIGLASWIRRCFLTRGCEWQSLLQRVTHQASIAVHGLAALRLDHRRRHLYNFNGHTDVKELRFICEDTITKGNWALNLGLRGDFYNGLTTHKEAEPRWASPTTSSGRTRFFAYPMRESWRRPFNENLVLSSMGCGNAVLNPLLGCIETGQATPLAPGWRNEFHAGIQQAFRTLPRVLGRVHLEVHAQRL